MKPRKKRWLISCRSLALAIFAFAQQAQAADYIGDCALIPNHVTGNATVSDTACVIDTGATLIVDGTLTIDATSVDVKSEIQSVGKVNIRTNGGGELKLRKKASSQNSDILLQSPQNRIETKALETGNSVQVDAGLNGAEGATWDIKIDGPIVASKLQAVPQDPRVHSNVLLRAVGPISTKTIRTDGGLGPASVKMGGIQIEAYRNGGIAADTAEFVIGGSGALNGVNGDLITHTTIGGGTDPVFMQGGVYVTMGGRFSTGSIRVDDMAAIKVRATQSRSGMIIMNSNLGTIFLPTGTLNANGDMANNQGAGLIFLLAKTLDVQPGTIISNNQSETAPGMGHQIFICVEKVKYRGDGTNGLKILNDGDGYPGYFSLVNISPQGYLVPTGLTSDVNQMPWNFTFSSAELAKDGPLTLDGTEGNAELLMRSDGNIAAVNVSGYPLAFNGGDVTMRSRGQTLHRINVGFFGTVTGAREGLTINNVGNWVLDANGKAPASGGSAAGGIIQVIADQSSLSALASATDPSSGNVIVRANGATDGGDGGIVYIDTKSFTLGDATHALVQADAAANGNGNAVNNLLDSNGPFAVTMKIGTADLSLGGGNKAARISANGGGKSGNGGGIKITQAAGNIKIKNSIAVDVSAIGNECDSSCNGGNLRISVPLLNSTVNNDIDPKQDTILANGAGSGSGGNIQLLSGDNLSVVGNILAHGGCSGGTGGNLKLVSNLLVEVNGDMDTQGGASEAGQGCLAIAARPAIQSLISQPSNGGTITLTAAEVKLLGQKLVADGHANGNGGNISIQNDTSNPIVLSNFVSAQLSAKAAGQDSTGAGGDIFILAAKRASGSTSLMDVLYYLKVDGGEDLDSSDPTKKDGRISLNAITCTQWRMSTNFPTTYWDCDLPFENRNADPNNGILYDVLANKLHVSRRLQLAGTPGNLETRLFVFTSQNNGHAFFDTHDPLGTSSIGETNFSDQDRNIYVSVYKTPLTSNTLANQMKGASFHELAHATDKTFDPPWQTNENGGLYYTYVRNDYLYLDYEDPDLQLPRDPCNAGTWNGSPVAAPFAFFSGVCDANGNLNL